MPASEGEFRELYRDLTGSERAFEPFLEAYESTGYSSADMTAWEDLDGFFEFLSANYPETSHSQEWWEEQRQLWREWSGTDMIDWDVLREALEEISPPQ